MEKDWIFRTDEYICDLRTVGVLEANMRCPVVMSRSVKPPPMDLPENTRKKPGLISRSESYSGQRNASGSGMARKPTTLRSTT